MIRLLHILFAVGCIGSMFIYSYQFTDPYIVPKWCLTLFVLFGMLLCTITMVLLHKPVSADMSIWGSIIIFSCLLQALYGILQYVGLYSSNATFRVTGGFDNPAGFTASLCAGLPFIGFLWLNKSKHVRCGGWMIGFVIVVAVILSQSRAGVMSIGFICFFLLNMRFFHKRWMKFLSLGCFVLLLYGCYWLKKDSADGRLLIWRCSMDMVEKASWLGHGIGSFEARYMDYQADYFRHYKHEQYSMLAGNVKHPFNEYIGVLLDFGLIGLFLIFAIITLLMRCYKKYPCMEKRIALYSLLSIGVFSLFSYPFTYPFTWIVTFLCVFILTKEYITKTFSQSTMRNTVCTLVLFCSLGGIYKLVKRVKVEKEWGQTSKLTLSREFDKVLPTYEKLEKAFADNPYFLYNYAAILTENKQYQKALEIALCCRFYWADYDLDLMIGKNYQHLNEPEQAEIYYENASMMCPSRFIPLNFLYDLYYETGNKQKALKIASRIIEMPVKVKSLVVNQIRYKMKQALLESKTHEMY